MEEIVPNIGFLLRFLILGTFVFGTSASMRSDESPLETAHRLVVIRASRILTLVASDTNEESLRAAMDTFTRHLVRVEIDKP
jgi:hypothetical protein